jgi:hypothetical protein
MAAPEPYMDVLVGVSQKAVQHRATYELRTFIGGLDGLRTSRTRRKYVHVGSGAASMLLTVPEILRPSSLVTLSAKFLIGFFTFRKNRRFFDDY